jgi:hypothetical protein
MEPINYSLFEYFVNKYPARTDGNGGEVGRRCGDADDDDDDDDDDGVEDIGDTSQLD